MQNVQSQAFLLINILMKVAVQCEQKGNKYKNWSRMDHKPNYFWDQLYYYREKILGKIDHK
jgi:hypothetical protein